MHARTYAHTHTHTPIHVCTLTCICMHMYTLICRHTQAYPHARLCTRTHRYMQTLTHFSACTRLKMWRQKIRKCEEADGFRELKNFIWSANKLTEDCHSGVDWWKLQPHMFVCRLSTQPILPIVHLWLRVVHQLTRIHLWNTTWNKKK